MLGKNKLKPQKYKKDHPVPKHCHIISHHLLTMQSMPGTNQMLRFKDKENNRLSAFTFIILRRIQYHRILWLIFFSSVAKKKGLHNKTQIESIFSLNQHTFLSKKNILIIMHSYQRTQLANITLSYWLSYSLSLLLLLLLFFTATALSSYSQTYILGGKKFFFNLGWRVSIQSCNFLSAN